MENTLEEFRKEPVTFILILINVLVFLVSDLTGYSQDVMHMLDLGAAYTPLITEGGEVYRLFTSMFLHFGIAHLLNNMLVLFVLGSRLERAAGKLSFLVIYLLGGVAGNVISLLLELDRGDYSVSAGASGAVFAVMGAMILYRGTEQGMAGRSFLAADRGHGSVFPVFRLCQQRSGQRRSCGRADLRRYPCGHSLSSRRRI